MNLKQWARGQGIHPVTALGSNGSAAFENVGVPLPWDLICTV
ncbi:MAG TPA: hypothetical protein VKY90_02530 [Candidatus Dormibacteraeota bacterium]|nr:hypothetical protein [Candidatus Dormibacteraeota bacterium]